MKKNIFDKKPPVIDQDQAKKFAGGSQVESKKPTPKASPKPKAKTAKSELPWEDPGVRADIDATILVALKEPTKIKLKWLSDNNHIKSMRSFCIDELTEVVNKEVKKALKEG